MTKTLKIDEGQALKLYKTASNEFKQVLEDTFGKDYFNQKITDKIQDLDDLFEYSGEDKLDVVIFKFPNNAFQKYINACAIIPRITQVYNEGEKLDWSNHSQSKYLPYYKKVGRPWVGTGFSGWGTCASCSVSHYFKSSELCLDAVKKFNDVYLDFYSYQG